MKADIVAVVDDDNIPLDGWGENLLVGQEADVNYYETDAPAFDPGRIPAEILALQPVGFLWLGLLVIVATPIGRVVVSLMGYLATGERRMALVSVAILVVIGVGVILGVAAER
jgi:uncharacterized membrane protein